MKKNQIAVILGGLGCALILVAGITRGIIGAKSKKGLTIGFYDTSDSVRQAIENVSQQFCDSTSTQINFYTFTNTSDIPSQIKKNKVDLILAPDGYALRNSVAAQKADIDISDIKLSALTSSMFEAAVIKDQKLKAVPVVFDNFEIDIDIAAFKSSGMKAIADWKQIEQFLQIQKKNIDYPASFAGAEPVFMLDLIGALGEAFEGKEAYDKAAEILIHAANGNFDASDTVNKLFINSDAPMAYSLYYLKQLIQNGYVTPGSQYLKHSDINSFLQQRVTNLFFTTLSIHRTYDVKAVDRYSSIYLPSENKPEQRHFTANITYVVPVSSNADNTALIQKLISTEAQTSISRATGLAPVLANCPTPDKQADDARYWVAATSTPLAGLGHEAEFSEEQLEQLLKAINSLLFS